LETIASPHVVIDFSQRPGRIVTPHGFERSIQHDPPRPYTFDHVAYDEEGDVLYMAIGKPRPAYDSPETPEGHIVRCDENYEVIGVTIVSAKWWLETKGELKVTLPETPAVGDTREVKAALAA
jgi:uncharacterized protein YuzE